MLRMVESMGRHNYWWEHNLSLHFSLYHRVAWIPWCWRRCQWSAFTKNPHWRAVTTIIFQIDWLQKTGVEYTLYVLVLYNNALISKGGLFIIILPYWYIISTASTRCTRSSHLYGYMSFAASTRCVRSYRCEQLINIRARLAMSHGQVLIARQRFWKCYCL